MKNSVLLPSHQAISKTVSRTNRINSIQIIKNIKRDVPRSNMFSLPKTQPTKNSSYLLYDLNNSQSLINQNIEAGEYEDQGSDNGHLNEIQNWNKRDMKIGRSMSTNRAMFKKRRIY